MLQLPLVFDAAQENPRFRGPSMRGGAMRLLAGHQIGNRWLDHGYRFEP
jgi:hypothetical protein